MMENLVLHKPRPAVRYDRGRFEAVQESVVVETEIRLLVNGTDFSTFTCSPADCRELAAGHLWFRGLVSSSDELLDLTFDESQGLVLARLNETTFQAPVKAAPGPEFSARVLLSLISDLERRSATFRETGGVHSAAIGGRSGLVVRCEDIGRHNAVDKVLGHALLNRMDMADKCLVLSGRVAHEIMVKAVRAGVPLVLSRSAPMNMALDLAERMNITVVGFARGERLTVYTHPERVVPV